MGRGGGGGGQLLMMNVCRFLGDVSGSKTCHNRRGFAKPFCLCFEISEVCRDTISKRVTIGQLRPICGGLSCARGEGI